MTSEGGVQVHMVSHGVELKCFEDCAPQKWIKNFWSPLRRPNRGAENPGHLLYFWILRLIFCLSYFNSGFMTTVWLTYFIKSWTYLNYSVTKIWKNCRGYLVCGFGTFLRLESALKSIELRSCATDATTAPHPAGIGFLKMILPG